MTICGSDIFDSSVNFSDLPKKSRNISRFQDGCEYKIFIQKHQIDLLFDRTNIRRSPKKVESFARNFPHGRNFSARGKPPIFESQKRTDTKNRPGKLAEDVSRFSGRRRKTHTHTTRERRARRRCSWINAGIVTVGAPVPHRAPRAPTVPPPENYEDPHWRWGAGRGRRRRWGRARGRRRGARRLAGDTVPAPWTANARFWPRLSQH